MDSKGMKELLEKYWKCETSLAEEQQLRQYFKNGDIPEALKETAALFQYFEESKKKSVSDISFEGDIMGKVSAPVKKTRVVRLFYNTMRIAAGLAVVFVATWFIRTEVRKATPQEIVDTYDDPKLAFEETKKALMMISRSFGTAETQAKKIDMFNEAREEIQKKKEVEL
jgi:hypothetical protein